MSNSEAVGEHLHYLVNVIEWVHLTMFPPSVHNPRDILGQCWESCGQMLRNEVGTGLVNERLTFVKNFGPNKVTDGAGPRRTDTNIFGGSDVFKLWILKYIVAL